MHRRQREPDGNGLALNAARRGDLRQRGARHPLRHPEGALVRHFAVMHVRQARVAQPHRVGRVRFDRRPFSIVDVELTQIDDVTALDEIVPQREQPPRRTGRQPPNHLAPADLPPRARIALELCLLVEHVADHDRLRSQRRQPVLRQLRALPRQPDAEALTREQERLGRNRVLDRRSHGASLSNTGAVPGPPVTRRQRQGARHHRGCRWMSTHQPLFSGASPGRERRFAALHAFTGPSARSIAANSSTDNVSARRFPSMPAVTSAASRS